MYTLVFIHTYICTRMHVHRFSAYNHISVSLHTYIHTYTHIGRYIHIYIYVCVYIYIYIETSHVRIYTAVHPCMCSCLYLCTCECMHVSLYVCTYELLYRCVCVYVYIYIYTHTCLSRSLGLAHGAPKKQCPVGKYVTCIPNTMEIRTLCTAPRTLNLKP